MKKRMTMIVALLLSVSLLAACGGSALAASPVVMKFANDDSSTSTYHFGLLEFERLVEEASKGAIDVQVFSDAVLGTSKDMLEGLQYGTLEAAFVVTSAMSNFVPEYSLLDGPFIFRDAAHAQKVADSK